MGLSERLEIDMSAAVRDLESLARECGMSGGDVKRFVDDAIGEIYDTELKPGTTAAGAILKGAAPNIRDVKAQTYAFVSDESDNEKAVIVFVSDSKQPDVLNKNRSTKYANGVDLSNVSNGRLSRRRATGFQSPAKTGRAVPMPSQGWWLRGLRAAVESITG